MHRDSVITACDISQSLRLKSPGTRTQRRLGETEESEGEENAWPACQVAIFGPTRPPLTARRVSLSSPNTYTCAHTDTRAHTFTLQHAFAWTHTHTFLCMHADTRESLRQCRHTWLSPDSEQTLPWQHTHTLNTQLKGRRGCVCMCVHSNGFQTHTHLHRRS